MTFRLSILPPDWFPFATSVSMPNAEGYRKALPVVQHIGTRAQVALTHDGLSQLVKVVVHMDDSCRVAETSYDNAWDFQLVDLHACCI